MKGYDYLSNMEVLNSFITFCRFFDDLGAVSTLQVIGQYLIAILKLILIDCQVLASVVIIIKAKNCEDHDIPLHYFREAFGLCYYSKVESIYSVRSLYTFIIIFILSFISIFIRLEQRFLKSIMPMPALIFNTFYNIISPLIITCICIGFASSLFNFVRSTNWNALIITMLSGLSLPSSIFALIRLLTDSRMEKLPYITPNYKLTMKTFSFYLSAIIGLIYIEYSKDEHVSSVFITIVLFVAGLILLYNIFKVPVYYNSFHSFMAIQIVFMECACLLTVCISRFKTLGSYESALRVLMANGVFVILALLHTYVSRWNLRRLLRSVEWIDPKKYSAARLTRILCVADIRKDQCKFPRNFPEVVLQTYPGKPSVIVLAILFKLYDPSAHKELLEFAENLSIFYSTNKYLSSMLRSIIFIASGTTTTKGTSISSSLLSICYKLEEQYWYHVIQNNTKTTQMAFHDLTQLVQRAKPFFERHNAVIGGNEDFSKYITLRPENYEDKIIMDLAEEEDKSDTTYSTIPLIDNHDDYFQTRLRNIKKETPANFVMSKLLGIIILSIIVFGCILGYLFGSASGIPSLRTYKSVQRMFMAYSNIVSAWSVPINLYISDNVTEAQKKEGLELINKSFDNIFTISYLKNTQNISELLLQAQKELIQATENHTFVRNSTTTDILFTRLMYRCKYLYTEFNTYGSNADKMANITLYGLTIVLIIFLVLFYLLMHRSQKLYYYLGCQTMHFKKSYSSYLRKKYQSMISKETKTLPESGKFNNSYLTFCVACLFPLVIGYVYALDMKVINKQFISFTKVSLLTSQITPMIANNNILMPLLVNDMQVDESLASIKLSYCFLMGLTNNIYTTNLSFEYMKFTSQTSYESIIKPDSESHETLIKAMKNVNKQIFVEMMNVSLVLVRDFYIILMESQLNEPVGEVAKLAIPLIVYSKNPLIDFLADVNKKLNFLADSVYFTFISAPILFFIAIFVMIVYGMVIISRINTSVDLMQRMICLPKFENPFFDENHNFLGYKDEVRTITNEIFNSFPIPTFQVSKDMKVVEQNPAAEAIFGDIKGTLMHNIPMEITDCYGTRNYYNYSTYLNKNLPSSLELKGEKVVISNDMTGLFNKKETLRNLYKDIRLTFSIPNVLQRDKATHIQNVAIVNFLFGSNVTNDQFLSYSSKIEDFFSQFVSFFMFEKMRFSFYVLFYDPNSSRQTCRDALAFAQIARYEGVNRKMEVKIAITMEDELIAIAQKNDMIWSVKFPNSILWRSDMMLANIDYGRIICLSKMSPGMHFSKTLSLGVHHEQIEVTTL